MVAKRTAQPSGSDGHYQRSQSVCTLADRDYLLNQNSNRPGGKARGFWRRKYQRFFPKKRAMRTPGPEERRKSQNWKDATVKLASRNTIAIDHSASDFPATVVTVRGTGQTINRLTISGPMPISPQSPEEKAEADAIKLECRGMMRRSTQRQAMSMIWV